VSNIANDDNAASHCSNGRVSPHSFWRRVDLSRASAECWPWLGSTNKDGYGIAKFGRVRTTAHRVAKMLHDDVQTLPTGIVVRHVCNNPPCCNPAHLLLGTQKDNAVDRNLANRQASGERNGRAKLSADLVSVIRTLSAQGMKVREIANLLGCSYGIVWSTLRRRTWRHLKSEHTK
jgi:hypothetical protein